MKHRCTSAESFPSTRRVHVIKSMWVNCPKCKKQVRNSLTALLAHAEECASATLFAERNALRQENAHLRAENVQLREQGVVRAAS